MTRRERWTLRFFGALTLIALAGVIYGIFSERMPRYALVCFTISMVTSAFRFVELADIALRNVAREAEKRPEGRR